MNLSEARTIIGSIGFPSKMPGTSYGLPAANCIAGSRLAKMPGTVCSQCYALRGNAKYQMPRAAIGLQRRLEAIGHLLWVDAMVLMLAHLHSKPAIKVDLGIPMRRRAQPNWPTRKPGQSRVRWNQPGFHRWHDTGDLQSAEHFAKIVAVCKRTPQIRHWLSTRELGFVRAYTEPLPTNLVIRISATMIDGPAAAGWPFASTVHTKTPSLGAYECPAPRQGHQCGTCRACWSADVPLVSYRLH